MIKGKRGAFDLQTYLVGMLIFMGIVVTFATTYIDTAAKYNIDTSSTESFSTTYNKLSTIHSFTKTEKDKLESTGLGDESSSTTSLADALGVVKLITSTISVPFAILVDIGKSFNIIPSMWIEIGISILVVLLITSVVFMIFQGRGR